MNRKTSYQYIPLELCAYVITNSLYSPFKLYIYLKSVCDGQIKLNRSQIKQIASELGYKSPKSINSNLNKLLELNWMGFNPSSGYYFIRGYDKIRKMFGFERVTAAEFKVDKLNDLNEFLTAAIIGKLINNKKRKLLGAERLKGRSNHPSGKLPHFYPIASSYLAKILGISINKAYRLKQKAALKKLIHIKYSTADTGFPTSQVKAFIQGSPELANRIVLKDSKILIQESDQIQSSIFFKTRKKIESYKKGTGMFNARLL